MIKTIICGCGKETDEFYGYPDDVLYCRECYIKDQTYYIQNHIDSKMKEIQRLQDEITVLEAEIESLPDRLEASHQTQIELAKVSD